MAEPCIQDGIEDIVAIRAAFGSELLEVLKLTPVIDESERAISGGRMRATRWLRANECAMKVPPDLGVISHTTMLAPPFK